MKSETIAAIATAVNPAGIGIIRISGDQAFAIADRIYRSKSGKKRLSDQPTHTIHSGYIYDGENTIDEVLVTIMRGPASFTTEDTVEINCHGGVVAMKKVLETVIKNGAAPAEPGEFTKRAFLNGRIDLSQAEAVLEIIHAKNEYALKSSVSQLKGSIHEKISELRKEIIYHIAFIESALDDPEHISLETYADRLKNENEGWMNQIKKLIDSAENGRVIAEGIKTVIVGKPNAGKSSLLNLMLGEERAIVTEIAGTTRDILQEPVYMNGITLNMIDTAGIRETEDIVEKIGVEKAKKYAEDADLIIYVADASSYLDKNDEEIIQMLENRQVIVLLNKTDLESVISEEDIRKKLPDKVVIPVSAKKKKGMDLFEETLRNMFFDGKISFNDEIYITNVRHKAALMDAYDSLKQVQSSLEMKMPEDFFSIDLMAAYESLGIILGESVGEDLVNEIFSKFCMGK